VRVALLLLSILLGPPAVADPWVERVDVAMGRGRDFLLARQGPDGAWRSADYGAFKDGFSLTPYVMVALQHAPPARGLSAAWSRGAGFLDRGLVDPAGRVLPHLNYPIYSLAGALFVLKGRARVVPPLIAALRARQLTEQHGWSAEDPSYGGWGYFAGDLRKPPAPDGEHLRSSNLSASLHALGALHWVGVPADDPAFVAARRFVERCQNHPAGDGGFFFTPANRLQNKADLDEATGRYLSYGSMTADGLRALRKVGHPMGSPRYAAAARWFDARFDAQRAPGDYPPARQVQRRSVYYYWAWSAAHVLMHRGDRERLRTLADALLARQGADGAWRNPATDLREDDPLLATPFALAVLGVARFVNTGQWRVSVGP
jgi:hypothetical protein